MKEEHLPRKNDFRFFRRVSVKDEPRQVWDEYYQSLSSDKPQSAAASEAMSRVDRSGTRLSLDIVGYAANFAYRTMNEEEKVLNCFEKSVNL